MCEVMQDEFFCSIINIEQNFGRDENPVGVQISLCYTFCGAPIVVVLQQGFRLIEILVKRCLSIIK